LKQGAAQYAARALQQQHASSSSSSTRQPPSKGRKPYSRQESTARRCRGFLVGLHELTALAAVLHCQRLSKCHVADTCWKRK
jgi:hypothetical protein